jgi:hypothetical protein
MEGFTEGVVILESKHMLPVGFFTLDPFPKDFGFFITATILRAFDRTISGLALASTIYATWRRREEARWERKATLQNLR